jgi:hypothetical protein
LPRPKKSPAAKFAVATDIIDRTEEHDAKLSDFDNDSTPDPESGAIATPDADEDDDAMPDALESAIVQSWLQRHEGMNAAGGGEDLELELEMQDLAAEGMKRKMPRKRERRKMTSRRRYWRRMEVRIALLMTRLRSKVSRATVSFHCLGH